MGRFVQMPARPGLRGNGKHRGCSPAFPPSSAQVAPSALLYENENNDEGVEREGFDEGQAEHEHH